MACPGPRRLEVAESGLESAVSFSEPHLLPLGPRRSCFSNQKLDTDCLVQSKEAIKWLLKESTNESDGGSATRVDLVSVGCSVSLCRVGWGSHRPPGQRLPCGRGLGEWAGGGAGSGGPGTHTRLPGRVGLPCQPASSAVRLQAYRGPSLGKYDTAQSKMKQH